MKWCKENIVLIPAEERGIRYKNTVYDNIMFFAAMKGSKEKEVKNLIEKYANELHFSQFLKEGWRPFQRKKKRKLCYCVVYVLI